jgi:ribose transport system ATP-binding protein
MSASSTAALSLVDVDKSFPGVHALKRVSIEIGHGEVVGLIGENGAGKSTLMKILSGVYQPDAGQILIAGQPTRLLDAADANRKGIGMVFQEQSLLTNLTVGENIYLGNEKQLTRFGIVDWNRLYEAAARQLAGCRSTPIRACALRTSISPRARWSNSPRR